RMEAALNMLNEKITMPARIILVSLSPLLWPSSSVTLVVLSISPSTRQSAKP
ncbi:hypothetical protein BGZ83_002713, partial [Gryganskiella cystojenkinii]